MARLPFVHARVIKRDGSGDAIALAYLISRTPDGPRTLITDEMLGTGTWAWRLGWIAPKEDRTRVAVATAIGELAFDKDVPETNEIPSSDGVGLINIPVPEALPHGYLRTAPVERTEALTAWREIVSIATRAPRMAHVLAAMAFGPFVGAIGGGQSHIVHMYGDAAGGKSTVTELAAAMWGDPTEAAVFGKWNTSRSGIGVGRLLGRLRYLPYVLDESGMARWGVTEWGQIIYELCDRSQRLVADGKVPNDFRISAPWHGTILSAGNGRITDGLTGGKFAGIPRRVLEIETPITPSAEDAERILPMLPGLFGHLGAEILARYTVTDARGLVQSVREHLPLPDGGIPRSIGKILLGHLAGAVMVDDIVGTETALFDAALIAAHAYMDTHAHEQIHDSEVLLDGIRESITREPAAWPTIKVYRAGRGDLPDLNPALPPHGFARDLKGVRADDGQWVAMFSAHFRELIETLGLDTSVALQRLWTDGVLKVPDGERKRGRWQAYMQVDSKPAPKTLVYKFALPDVPDDTDHDTSTGGGHSPRHSEGHSPVHSEKPALTCEGHRGHSESTTQLLGDQQLPLTDPESRPESEGQEQEPEALPDGALMVGPYGLVVRLDGREPCRGCGRPAPYRDDLGPVHPGGNCWDPGLRSPGTEESRDSGTASDWPAVPEPPVDLMDIPAPRSVPDTDPQPVRAARRHVVAALDSSGLWVAGADSPRPVDQMPASRAACVELALAARVDRLFVYPDAAPAELPDRIPAEDTVRHPWADLSETPFTTEPDAADNVLRPYSVVRRRDDGRSVILTLVRLDPVWEGRPVAALPSPADLVAGHSTFHRQFGAWWFVSKQHMFRSLLERAIDRTSYAERVQRVDAIANLEIPVIGANETTLFSKGSRPLSAGEDGMIFLSGLDRISAYPTAMSQTLVGIGEPHHITAPFQFEKGKHGRMSGYVRTNQQIDIDPHIDGMLRLGEGWLTTGQARMLARGIKTPNDPKPEPLFNLEITEAWLWDESGSVELFRGFGREIREARSVFIAGRDGLGGAVALDLLKQMASAFGALSPGIGGGPAETRERGRLWRPDWAEQIRGQAQANILAEVLRIGKSRNRWPVALNVDEMVYATDHLDGAKLADELGMKYDAAGAKGGHWRIKDRPTALTEISQWCGELTFWSRLHAMRRKG